MRVVERCGEEGDRRWDEKNKDRRKTIWEGKYLFIHVSERDHTTHLCCSMSAACAFS